MADAKALLGLLFESACAGVRVRRAYSTRRRAYNDKYFTYGLLLQNDAVYVGTTNNIYARLLEHELMSPSSSLWVRQHGPVKRVLEIGVDAARGAEAERTLHYMSMFGWQQVRGAAWCRVQMASPPTALADYVPGRTPHRLMTLAEIDDVVTKVKQLAAACEFTDSPGPASPDPASPGPASPDPASPGRESPGRKRSL